MQAAGAATRLPCGFEVGTDTIHLGPQSSSNSSAGLCDVDIYSRCSLAMRHMLSDTGMIPIICQAVCSY
jgi:hypothetical protein